MSKKDKKKIKVNPDKTIDSIIEETRILSEQEKMEKEAAKFSGGPKMEEIYSNKSKEIRLIDKAPRLGAEKLQIAFLHPKSTCGVLTELCEH